ncbi:MAG: hypothetical protein ACE5G7_03760 [Candidatus Hydrothermarchaeaceae archaeon]
MPKKKLTMKDVLELKPGEGLVIEKPRVEIVTKNEARKAKVTRSRKA